MLISVWRVYLGAHGLQFADLPVNCCRLAFQRQHTRRLGQTLLQKRALVGQFLPDQGALRFGRDGLGADAFDLIVDLLGLGCQLIQRLLQRAAAGREQALLRGHQLRQRLLLGGAVQQHLREGDRFAFVSLGLQPAATGEHFVVLPLDDGEFGAQQVAIQLDQHVTGTDLLALAHEDLVDHAPVRVLDDLAMLFDLDLAGGDDGTGDPGADRPSAEACEQHENRDQPQHHGRAS